MLRLIKTLFCTLLVVLVLGLGLLGLSAWQVFDYANNSETTPAKADAAVVLGAAAWGKNPSPVYRERIQHAIDLYKKQIVSKIIFTGGTPKAGYPTEAEVGKLFAEKQKVSSKDILLENTSRDTLQNIHRAKKIMRQHQIDSVILVSDPDHMARAMAIAKHFGVNAVSSATPSSRYTGSNQRDEFFWREVLYLSLFRVYQIGGKLGIRVNTEMWQN